MSVVDNGIGLSDATKLTLFQPFQQGMRLAGGTGLGLYSLSKRIDALGGKCGVNDRDDGVQGACFWFSFPYKPDFDASIDSEEIYQKSAKILPQLKYLHQEIVSSKKYEIPTQENK